MDPNGAGGGPPIQAGGPVQQADVNNGDRVPLPQDVLNADVPDAPMEAGVMVDALTAIAQTLVGLQQSNEMHLRSNEFHQNQADRRAQEQAIRAARKEWLDEEAVRVSTCEGLPKPTMRAWLKAVSAAMGRFPDRGLGLLATDPQQAGGIQVSQGRARPGVISWLRRIGGSTGGVPGV